MFQSCSNRQVMILWDVIMCEGLPVILRIAVSILQAQWCRLLRLRYEDREQLTKFHVLTCFNMFFKSLGEMFFFFFQGRKCQNHSKPALGMVWPLLDLQISYISSTQISKNCRLAPWHPAGVKPGAGFEGFLAVHGVWGSSSARCGLVDIGGHGDKETPVVLKK